jgi:hypothetical protein
VRAVTGHRGGAGDGVPVACVSAFVASAISGAAVSDGLGRAIGVTAACSSPSRPHRDDDRRHQARCAARCWAASCSASDARGHFGAAARGIAAFGLLFLLLVLRPGGLLAQNFAAREAAALRRV